MVLFDDSDVLRFDVGAYCSEHFKVDEKHTFGSSFGFQKSSFIPIK